MYEGSPLPLATRSRDGVRVLHLEPGAISNELLRAPTRTHPGGGVVVPSYAAVQNGDREAWIKKHGGDEGKRFGYYHVAPVDPRSKENRYLHSVLLHYGEGGNHSLDPSAGIRDYLVQVDPDNRDLFLGKAYYKVGPIRVHSNFFILERHERVSGQPHRPNKSVA